MSLKNTSIGKLIPDVMQTNLQFAAAVRQVQPTIKKTFASYSHVPVQYVINTYSESKYASNNVQYICNLTKLIINVNKNLSNYTRT